MVTPPRLAFLRFRQVRARGAHALDDARRDVEVDGAWANSTNSCDDAEMDEIEVVVAHRERATVRVGDVFLKIDSDQARIDRELEAMAIVPLPTAEVLWRHPPVLALASVRGAPLARLGEPATASRKAWSAAGAAVRALHDTSLPPWSGASTDAVAAKLAVECSGLISEGVLPADVVRANQRLAETALEYISPVFIHGDLQVDHVFVEGDEVTAMLDWSEAAPGDAAFDLATLTLGHPEHLDDVLDGYGGDVDRERIRAWWSLRCLSNVRWLMSAGYGDPETFPEVAFLRTTI